MEKEMENKAEEKATPVWIVSQKHASLQLWYLGGDYCKVTGRNWTVSIENSSGG